MLLIVLLLAPIAEAHIAGARPVLQRGQFDRTVDLQPIGLTMIADLVLSSPQLREPQRNLITHVLDPALGRFYVEHRLDASVSDERFWAEWRFERLVEYRDANVNGRFEPGVDTPVKVFRFSQYDWRMTSVQTVQLADVTGTSIVWEGNRTGLPAVRIEVAMAGKSFADEGAIVFAQDAAIYMDILDIPSRDVGSLYALEITALVDDRTQLSFHKVENVTTALLADAPFRRALLVWGGEGFLDGREQVLEATIEEERIDDFGNRTARVVLHMPTVDRSMRFVIVTGIEYATENVRAPMPDAGLLALVVTAAALALGRRR